MSEVNPVIGWSLSQRHPFPGLRPYEEADADWFFGRSSEINDLLKRLRRLHFIAIVGASGSGKSSLVRAGLLPQIRHGFLDAEWQIAIFRPDERPIANLAEALGPEIVSDPDDPMNMLRSGDFGLVRALQGAKLKEDAKLFILVDQFEEIFQFAQRRGDSGQEEVKEFLKLLLTAAASDDVDVYVALTMRLEWLNECASYAGLAEAINAGIYLVPQMQRRQFGQAIRGPLEFANAGLTSALFDRMLNDLDNRTDQLPVLQHALLRLWERNGGTAPLDIAGYEAVGTFSSCLSAHAEEVYGELTERERRVAELLFRTITQVSKGRKIRRAMQVSEIMKSTRLEFDELAPIIVAFSKPGRSFLVTTEGALTPASVVDISHEALIRQWTRLSVWVDNEAETQVRLRRLEEDADEWSTDRAAMKECLYSGARLIRAEELLSMLDPNSLSLVFLKDSRRQYFWLQVRRRGWIVLAVLAMIGTALGIAWVNRERAKEATALAMVAEANRKSADIEANAASIQAQKANEDREHIVQEIKDAQGSATKLAAIAKNIEAERIYIQYASDERQTAKAVQARLVRSGFAVPGIDQVASGTNQTTQVGYYHPEDEADATRIAKLVAQQLPGAIAEAVPNPKKVVPRGQFEILIGPLTPASTSTTTPSTANKTEAVPVVALPPAPVAVPPTLTASLSQYTVEQGQAVTLTWDAENASKVQLSGFGRVELKGSQVLTPQKLETYTLIADGDGGTVQKALTVKVVPATTAAPVPVTSNNDLSGVKDALNRYEDAYESESLEAMKQAWPSLSKAGEKTMKDTFEHFNAIHVTLNCQDDSVRIAGATASAVCQETATYTERGKVQPKQAAKVTFTLKKMGAEWVIDTVK
jgi:KaiC/GvpD/RAD55 family RecA-like ATPase